MGFLFASHIKYKRYNYLYLGFLYLLSNSKQQSAITNPIVPTFELTH